MALGFQQELQALAARLQVLPEPDALDALQVAIEGADQRGADLEALGLDELDLLPTLQWSTALRVLRDLLTQGWALRIDDEGVLLNAPGGAGDGGDPEVRKQAIRRSFSFARNAQLGEATTAKFITSTERRGIHRIFADGAELADRLATVGTEAIAPELELVEKGARDATTGIFLQDIWRYARHFWSIPYQSTPGRNMFYLVRDGARPERPLIGIAALGNPVLGLAQRDDYAGWSIRGLREHLSKMSTKRRRALQRRLLAELETAKTEIYSADLPPVRGKWPGSVEALEQIERDSAADRVSKLGKTSDGRGPEYREIRAAHTAVAKGSAEDVDWEAVAKTDLYRRKRAGALADIVRAQGILKDLGAFDAEDWLEDVIDNEMGQRAVEIALRRIKQTVIASSVMELITCGAVPPYRDALGGKLVSLMMLSRTVVGDYQRKYADQVSLIASAQAGRIVRRPTRLALLTTSSLYAVGSSQYNRLRLPFKNEQVAYKRMGITESFGTVHFAPDTVSALSAVARLAHSDTRRISNLFGEGTSPKLRLVRAGLESLGLEPDVFLRHHSPRLLYGAALCSNMSDVLLGLTDRPRYVLPAGDKSTDLIVEHWRERWLAKRVIRQDVLDRVRAESKDEFLLGNDPAVGVLGTPDGRGATVEPTADASIRIFANSKESTFIERLYRSSNSYADRLTQDELDAIHVDLGVDGFLVEEANKKKQIVVTGNPGDGKTHLIERLRPELEAAGAEVITDANACSDEDTLRTWEKCRKAGKPFVLAINEWPLYVLQRLARTRNFTPVDEALRQVRAARYFIASQKPEDPKEDVVTIDLSLRNLLAPGVVRKVIERLTDDRFYKGLNDADPMLSNRRALREPQVSERLADVLELLAVRIGHVTMRQLVGMVAYLLTAGQSAADRLKAGQDETGLSYSNLAFEGGEGVLFDTLRDVFDPAAMTHPLWDEELWRGGLHSKDWLIGGPAGVLALPEAEREAGFRATKRRFFFEHTAGESLLELKPKDEADFEHTLAEGESGRTAVVRDLVLALNRFYEPDFPEKDRDRLLLWQSHRYDVRAPAAFVSLRELPHQQLRIESLQYADWVERWLPPEQQARRSFALVASDSSGNDIAVLEIDRELYLTLVEAHRGLGRSSWSRTATRRITRFVDRIDREVQAGSGVEDLRIRNVESDLDERFAIQRSPARYQL